MIEPFKKAAWFCLITFGLSWGMFEAAKILSKGTMTASMWAVVSLAFMVTPMIAAVMVQSLIYHEPLKDPLGISFHFNVWFLVAWLLPLALVLGALGVGLLFPGVHWVWDVEALVQNIVRLSSHSVSTDQIATLRAQMQSMPMHPFWLSMINGMLAGLTINAVAGFGEELGWRGFLQKELGFLGFWRSSIFIGVIWGIWHAPLILQGHNFPQHPKEGVFYMVYFTILSAPLFAYIRTRARSVVAASIMHGTVNGVAGLAVMVLQGGSDLLIGITGLAGLLVLALANLLLLVYDRWISSDPIIHPLKEIASRLPQQP